MTIPAILRLTPTPLTRREHLGRAPGGFGATELSGVLAELSASAAVGARGGDAESLSRREPHRRARAKRVIFLHMSGGVSHVDTFDPKPGLFSRHGQSITVDNWQGRP